MLTFVNDLDGYKLTVKLHPGKHALPYSLKPLIQSIDTSIPIYQSGNILKYLKNYKANEVLACFSDLSLKNFTNINIHMQDLFFAESQQFH